MIDTSRIYFEHPPAYAAIQNVHNANKINGFNSVTPAKAKRSWGNLLRIPGRSKKNSPNIVSNGNNSYPPAFNLPSPSPYSSDSYYLNSNITVRQYDPYGREYLANFGQNYGSYNTTYSRGSINPSVPKQDAKARQGLQNKSISYNDWFGTVVSKQSPARPRINSPSSPFYISENNASPVWGGSGSVRSPPAVIPATFPVQLYSNLCLCPEQLYSTKSKSRKKCKKCGCKIATIRNATSISTTKIRPIIPPNFYQPPALSWHVSPNQHLPSQYAHPNNHLDAKSTFSPLEEIDEYESPPRTPETIKSFQSSLSSDSNATLTKSNIRPRTIIPCPPKLPLPPVPDSSTNGACNKKFSIIEETKSAYELMADTGNEQEISDSDDLNDNILSNSYEERTSNVSSFLNFADSRNETKHNKEKGNNTERNVFSSDIASKNRRGNFLHTFGENNQSGAIKLKSRSSPNIAKHLDLTNNMKNVSNSSSKGIHESPKRSFESQYERKFKRYSDIPDVAKYSELTTHYNQNAHLSKASSHQSLFINKDNLRNMRKATNSPKCRPTPPRRDQSKLVSIAGQRILFDKCQSPYINNSDNVHQIKTEPNIDGWENISENNEYKFENSHILDTKVVTSLREPNESGVTQILKPFTKKRNLSKESKSSFYGSPFDTIIKEEEELKDQDYFSKNTATETSTHQRLAYEESDISSVSDSSPERNCRFESSLSDLLKVKSILKRPNSVDTSSENDSDFYLPTYSEFKQMQKKKKSVQFLHSLAANTLIENEKDFQSPNITEYSHQDMDGITDNKNGMCEAYTISNSDARMKTKKSPLNVFEINEEILSEHSKDLNHRLHNDQTNDLQHSKFTSQSNASKIPLLYKATIEDDRPKKLMSTPRLITIPNRPTVPPPPPPQQPQNKPTSTETSNTYRHNIYDLSSISCTNNKELEEENDIHSNSSLSSTPPPLPSSSPPPLDEDEFIPVKIFTNSNEMESDPIIDSDISYRKSASFEDPDRSKFSSKIPIITSSLDRQAINVPKNKKVLMCAVPSSSVKPISKTKNSKTTRNDKSKSSQDVSFHKTPAVNNKIINSEIDDHFTDHIYEELRSITSSPSSNERSLSPERSIFDGASKYEILEFLRKARKRVRMNDEDDELLSETIRNEMEVLTVDDEECRVTIEPQDEIIISSIYRDGRSSNRSSNSDSSENSGLLRSDKERLLSGEIERTDSGVGSETSKPIITVRQQLTTGHSDSNGLNTGLRDRNLPPCDDCDFPVEAKVTNGGVMYAPLVCHRCSRRRQERKEILMEIIETEVKYGRDLKVMIDQFYKPMQVAGLLTPDQLQRIFINVEELVDHNRQFALQIKDAYEIALDQGDEDFLTVNVAKLFIQSSSMLHSFQSYCVRQSEASFYLQNLERDRELLRIFLRVSQMENTLLRRMNLHSFLMVPVQRITKYPLLLSRLYKTTPPSHSSREDCRKAREKIELYLQHINNETKGSSSTKLWRRISMSVGGSNGPPKRISHPPEYDTSLKLRAVALEVLDWTNEEATVVREGRLLCLPPESGNWTRRGRGIKMASVQVALVTLGRPRATLEEKIPEDGLITPKSLGIKEAAILAFKDHRLLKSALIRDPWLLSKVVLSWDSEGETESFELTDMTTKETFIFRDRDSVSTEEWFRSAQFHALSVGTWRLRRPALANIMINGARS